MSITRRKALALTSAATLLGLASQAGAAEGEDILETLGVAQSRVIPSDPEASVAQLSLRMRRSGGLFRFTLTNRGAHPVAVKEIVLWEGAHNLPAATEIYGEGFTMLSTTSGTLSEPVAERYTDARHYRISQPADSITAYGVTLFSPPQSPHLLVGYVSCKQFVGAINIWADTLRLAFDAENLSIAPGETWRLDPIFVCRDNDRNRVLARFARLMAREMNARASAPLHTGWSSWNALEEDPRFEEVVANARIAQERAPMLDYIQLDDGYQAAMGDWFDVRDDFGGSMAGLCETIRRIGKKPAIWVAPLIAEQSSTVFQAHPDWFIRDDNDAPLRADRVSFAGWRRGPWFALDGSHPEAQHHLEQTFARMRTEWGVDYFKLDALFWGALHGGRFHDPSVSRVQAYRSALAAIRRGAGDAFITVANAPLWPTVGFADASRASNDVHTSWTSFKEVARQNLRRSWMHRSLWLTDPDSFMLGGPMSASEFRVHWTSVYISGGIFLTGDDLTQIPPERIAILQRLGRPAGFRPEVADARLQTVTTDRGPLGVFNWDDLPQDIVVQGPRASRWRDFWTEREVAFGPSGVATVTLGSRDALLLHRVRN